MKFPGLFLLALLAASAAAGADIVVRDDTGQEIRLVRPAQRIVSLAPHITEVLFAAGAGARVVGTVEFSDFPAAAKSIPRVGSNARVDTEALLALKPDLVIGWQSGNAPGIVRQLRALGSPLFLSQPERIEDVARSIEQFGRLAGTLEVAQQAAREFRGRYRELESRYADRPPVRVFYEIWNQPLMTINGRQIISDVLRLCGARNVFADVPVLASAISVEAVLAADPDAIIASGMGEARPEWLDDWRRWPRLAAVRRGNLFFVPPELIQRHTPRLLEGAAKVCADLDLARSRQQR